ncbi:MAG: acetyltransferase [Nitrososphaerales archaeon]
MAGFSADEALRIGEAVRAACVRAALDAYERASIDGLCEEGALEVAMDAVRGLDVRRLVEELGRKPAEG